MNNWVLIQWSQGQQRKGHYECNLRPVSHPCSLAINSKINTNFYIISPDFLLNPHRTSLLQTSNNDHYWSCIKCEIKKQKIKISNPDVLFLIDGEVGVEIDHLWCSIGWSGIPCDLHITEKTKWVKQSRGNCPATVWWAVGTSGL